MTALSPVMRSDPSAFGFVTMILMFFTSAGLRAKPGWPYDWPKVTLTVFVAPGSLLGVPAVSLPLLGAEGLPLGLQVMGFEQQDAALIGVARWVEVALGRG